MGRNIFGFRQSDLRNPGVKCGGFYNGRHIDDTVYSTVYECTAPEEIKDTCKNYVNGNCSNKNKE